MHRYSHLLSGAASGLECASCLHVDDIGRPIDLDPFLEEAVAFFNRLGEKPKRVSYWLDHESKPRRSSLKRFMNNFLDAGHTIGTTFQGLSISGVGFEGNDMSDTWTPRSVFSCGRHGRTIKAFFQSPCNFGEERNILPKLPFCLFPAFSSAYIFEYPFVFSPLAYTSGISYGPNVKSWGDHNARDTERVTNWSNHCYRGHKASEGYLRDVYPVNVIGSAQAEALIGSVKLEDWIKQDPSRGILLPLNDKMLWEIGDRDILSVQRALDKFKILLSAFPPK
jgi:hypothetical protein